jgi:hypothetical protein
MKIGLWIIVMTALFVGILGQAYWWMPAAYVAILYAITSLGDRRLD